MNLTTQLSLFIALIAFLATFSVANPMPQVNRVLFDLDDVRLTEDGPQARNRSTSQIVQEESHEEESYEEEGHAED